MGPELQPDVPLLEVLLWGVLNPATIAVAFWMGTKANEPAKIMIAAFAGAAAGFALLFLTALLGLLDSPTVGRAAVGVFIVSLIAGLAYAGAGYLMRRRG